MSFPGFRMFRIPAFVLPLLLTFMLSATFSPAFSQKRNKKQEKLPEKTSIVLASDRASKYSIVIPTHASPNEQKAATVLQDHLLQITGAALPIVPANKVRQPYEIVIGQNERLDQLGVRVNYASLGEDGFMIKTDSMRLIIAGGANGTLHGTFSFLEKYAGCRMYDSKVKIIPQKNTFSLPVINETQVPAIGFRNTHYRDTWDSAYSEWHKLNARSEWGMWVHTFNALVPPEMYYEAHPEYFAMVKGKRIPTQLCLANPEVLELTIQNLRKKIAQNPQAKYWSVSQNDNRDYCTCDQCRAIDEQEGSPSGSIIRFVNQVADQFPDKMISTLAYEYGRHAPKTLKPRDNVNIMLCSIEAYRDKALTDDTASATFVQDVKDWGRISKDIIVWDYVIQFNHLVSPFPNLHVLQPNLQFFAKNGVNAMFEQGNSEVGGEFSALRAYMISKLMWDPYQNADSLMNDFLFGYYGAAGKPIRQYIDDMRAALLKAGKPLRIFGTPNDAADTYLTPGLLKHYNKLFDEAESLVRDSSIIFERVRIARMPLMYATLEQARKNFTGENGLLVKVNGKWEPRMEIYNMVDDFIDLCHRQGVTQLKEWATPPDEYRASMYRVFAQGMNEHLAFGKPVTLISPDTSALKPEQLQMLTDGKRAGHDLGINWVGVSGKNLEVVIDLGETKKVRKIGSGYYQLAFWLLILPTEVEYFVSDDGKKFERVAQVKNTLPIDQYKGYIREFNATFDAKDARYIKVIAHTLGNTPGWHPGAGRPARIQIDEIVVE